MAAAENGLRTRRIGHAQRRSARTSESRSGCTNDRRDHRPGGGGRRCVAYAVRCRWLLDRWQRASARASAFRDNAGAIGRAARAPQGTKLTGQASSSRHFCSTAHPTVPHDGQRLLLRGQSSHDLDADAAAARCPCRTKAAAGAPAPMPARAIPIVRHGARRTGPARSPRRQSDCRRRTGPLGFGPDLDFLISHSRGRSQGWVRQASPRTLAALLRPDADLRPDRTCGLSRAQLRGAHTSARRCGVKPNCRPISAGGVAVTLSQSSRSISAGVSEGER